MAAKKAAKKGVSFKFAILGQAPSRKTATKGVTLGHLREKFSLMDLTIKVNGQTVADDSYKIQQDDSIVVVTAVKGGC